jgi:hypothetical protein
MEIYRRPREGGDPALNIELDVKGLHTQKQGVSPLQGLPFQGLQVESQRPVQDTHDTPCLNTGR